MIKSKTAGDWRPLVLQLADLVSEDEEFVNMLSCLETKVENFAPEELRKISKYRTDLSVINLETGARIIIRNGCEILVPKPLRERMLSTLHFTHYSHETMMKQA